MTAKYDFFFAWVDPTDTTYSNAFARTDEEVFSFVVQHDEGQIPKLTLEVINPRVGFLAPGRKTWAWLSYSFNGGAAEPIYFGRLIGVPTDILSNIVTMQFIARPSDFFRKKQRIAETLKVLPYYDPIFVDIAHRDDPDTILEGWSLLYHVDRTTLEVTASDILVGEGGTVTFTDQDVFYDSVKMQLLQSPLKAVNVKAEVTWQQAARGQFSVGTWAWPTIGGDSFVGDWPKSGSSIGSSGGYFATVAWAGQRDPSIVNAALLDWTGNVSWTYQWRNEQAAVDLGSIHIPAHATGDTMSIDISMSYPIAATAPTFKSIVVNWSKQNGLVDPGHVDEQGDPDPINIPLIYDEQRFCWREFSLDDTGKQSVAFLELGYEASRQRTERIDMTLVADVQAVLTDPLVQEDTDTISLKSGDLGLPLIDLLNWDSVAGLHVDLGTMIFPSNQFVVGQDTAQICTTAGTAGTDEPVFSNIAGVTTADGGVVWTSLGQAVPPEQAQDWNRSSPASLGTMIVPKTIYGIPDRSSIIAAGTLNFPPTGTPVSKYTLISEGAPGPGSVVYECTDGGILGGLSIAQAVFNQFSNPNGFNLYICVSAGTTGEFHCTFDETLGARTTDGTAVWQNIGTISVPVGGYPGNTPARSYFPSDRGQQSLENLLMRARAKLRKRARAVQVSFETRFEAAADLDCRKNATLSDIRLPGGVAAGKVTSYSLIADGDKQQVYGQVTIGCSIGNYNVVSSGDVILDSGGGGGGVTADPGIPDYVEDGYVDDYQTYTGSVIPSPIDTPSAATGGVVMGAEPANQFGYTPPVEQVTDDGIVFPATAADLILSSMWHGVPSTLNAGNIEATNLQLEQAIYEAVREALLNPPQPPPLMVDNGFTTTIVANATTVDWNAIQTNVQQAVMQSVFQGTGLWYELALRPLDTGPFAASYVVETTPLVLPMTIDLSAPSQGG